MMTSAIDLTSTDLRSMKTVELRKLAGAAGLKGQSSARKEHLLGLLEPLQLAQIDEKAKATPVVKIRKGYCNICGVHKADFGASDLCAVCREEGEWENTHSDENHEGDNALFDGCWICHPELNLAKRPARAGRSRAGMVVIAKGTEIHKSEIFKTAAEAAGWTVRVMDTFEGTDGESARYIATATRPTHLGADDSIELSWNGRAYDYDASGAHLNGKDRKVRNLKEALRLL